MFAFEMCYFLNAVLHFSRDVRRFVCAMFGFVCKVLKKCVSG